MRKRGRAVLLCGHGRATIAAIARELARTEVPLLLQAAPADRAAARRLASAVTRTGTVITLVEGALGGDKQSERLLTAAWEAARAIETVVICVRAPASHAATELDLEGWQRGVAAGLRAPFFLATHAARRLGRAGGGRLIVAIDAPARTAGPVAAVVRSGLLCMVDGLTKGVPKSVVVNAVVHSRAGAAHDTAAEIARGVGFFVAGEAHPSGSVLELGVPAHRG